MGDVNKQQNLDFYRLGIAPGILEILKKIHYTVPTPIQYQSIPIAIQGKDIVGVAQTGTGKTLAFGIPMIQRLASTKGLGLVLLPTRELALQIDAELHKVGSSLGLRTAVLIGGVPIRPQISSIRKNPHIIIATPGRLIDHLHQKTVNLKNVNILILDEATSAVDAITEKEIQNNMRTILSGKTAIIIAHRLSTVQKADEIIVLDNKKIEEQGSHEQLLKKKGIYASLHLIQSGQMEKLKHWDLIS